MNIKATGLTRFWWLLLIFAAVVFLRAPLLNIPFERDEGEYAYISWRMGFEELPYRDWVNQKPPGVFWAYRLALALPFDAVFSIHLVAALFAAASACALALIARRFLPDFWAAVAGLLLGLLSADPAAQGNAANTEVFMVLPMLLAQLVFLGAVQKKNRGWMLLCGALTGLAALFKQVAAVNWFALALLWPVFDRSAGRWRGAARFAGLSAAGAAIIWTFVLTEFWFKHGLGYFIYNVLTHNLAYVHTVPWHYRLLLLWSAIRQFSGSEMTVWLFAVLGIVALALKRRFDWLFFVLVVGCADAVGVSASGYYFPHYFQQLLPVLALCAAAGACGLDAAAFMARIPRWGRRTGLAVILAAPFVFFFYPFYFIYTPVQAVSRIYPGNLFGIMPVVARRLAEVTRPEDCVFLYAAEPELLFYARRACATRYLILFPLFGPYADAHERQVATATEISSSQPTAAFYLNNDLFSIPGTDPYFNNWAGDFLRQNFQGDSWLTLDSSGRSHFIVSPAQPDSVIGVLFVRKKAP